jgi:hypothetical protein
VENHQAVKGLESTKSRVRTLLLWDGGNRWWLGLSSACTLAQAAATLSQAPPTGWPVKYALNLDGGSSSDLAIAASVDGGPIVKRDWWNRPVRNFLMLVPL